MGITIDHASIMHHQAGQLSTRSTHVDQKAKIYGVYCI